MPVGHDEYWSAGERTNVEAARAAGVHIAIFSGNQGFWKTRWEVSIDGTGTPHRTLVCYKETHANAKIDPLPGVWTGTWRDPRFGPHDGGLPENALNGSIFAVNGLQYDAMEVPAADGKMRFWRNTSVASLGAGQVATLPTGVLGTEWDEDIDNGFRPAGLVRLSTTTVAGVPRLADYGTTFISGTSTHHLTFYRHGSGALVFAAGTIQWPWGLDDQHDLPGAPTDARMQQATVNLLADMGVQAATLQPALVAATASSDTTSPVAAFVEPATGATINVGIPTIVSGTASDVGGEVGAVEISTDGGATWHPAAGRAVWTYEWVPTAIGPATLLARAVDDSGNLGEAAAVDVDVVERTCPCSIWPDTAVPAVPSGDDTNAVELGVRFQADVRGLVTGVRFYKGGPNTGPHTGRLWRGDGALLGAVLFTDESAEGWQTATFEVPIPIDPDTTYVASYHTTVGRYAGELGTFGTVGIDRPPLHLLRDGADGPSGVYHYGAGGVFPINTYFSSNYWVDVVFEVDADGDGSPLPEDCDDTNPAVHPGAPELCNLVDDDCDDVVDGAAANAACDDGLFCTGVETCSGGSCVASGDPCGAGAECANVCDEAAGNCLVPGGTACADDGEECTTDACNGAGVCIHLPIPNCGTTTTTSTSSSTSTSTSTSSTTSTSTSTSTSSTTSTSTSSSSTSSTSSTAPLPSTTTTTIPACPLAPVSGCATAAARKTSLVVKDASRPGKDTLAWKWIGAGPVALAEFGSPTGASDYLLCVYAGGSLAFEGLAPKGGTCAGKPCWRAVAHGFRYRSPAATPDGIGKVVLKSGATGRVMVSAKGGNLIVPALALATPVEVQTRRADGGALQIGGAIVSEKHANFFIAQKGCTSRDVMRLIEMVKEKVQKQFNVELELEIEIWK